MRNRVREWTGASEVGRKEIPLRGSETEREREREREREWEGSEGRFRGFG